MQTIPITHRDEPSLQQLRGFDVLLREHSLTRAARELGITQPALSKTLATTKTIF
jgi:DNA-binding transcriptional LysR family regulator